MYSLLVNLLLLTSLEKRFTHGELDCFLEAGDRNDLKEEVLVDKTTRDRFVLFWEATARPEVEDFPASESETQEPLSLLILHSNIHGHVFSSSNQ